MVRNGNTSFDATINGGLPVHIEARIYPPEPDVGIFHQQVEILDIQWPGRFSKGRYKPGKTIPSTLYERAISQDLESLETLALESAE